MADGRLALQNSWLKAIEIRQKTKVKVVGEGGYYPSKFKGKTELAVIVLFDGIERKLPINQRSLITISNSFTLETKMWVGKHLWIFARSTRVGGEVAIFADPALESRENVKAFAPIKKE